MNTVYAVCMIGFAFSAVRAVQVLIINWRRGYSVLERPEIGFEGQA
jgi:TRAP-type C4-dicarboxylate transport system permease small subunit